MTQVALEPANRELKKRMPSNSTSASEEASTNGDVRLVYPHAIEISGHTQAVKGLGIFFGIIIGIVSVCLGSFILLDGFIIIGAPLLAMGIYTSAIFFRSDFHAYRDEPVLFNRVTRKIHVFRVRKNIKRPFSRWPLTIDTYDWDCAHGEVGGGIVPGKVALLRYKLYVAITENPKSNHVLDRFFFGSPRNAIKEVTWLWEHIRRYMEEGGPALPNGEALSKSRYFSSLDTWSEHFPWLDPEKGLKRFGTAGFWLMTLAGLVTFPVMFLLAFSTWLARWSSREPIWQNEIIATLGGPALPSSAVESSEEPVNGEQEGRNGPRKPTLSTSASSERRKQKWKIKPETRKAIIAIVVIAALIAIAKLAQLKIRGY